MEKREIKFRGLYREIGAAPRWVYGSLIYTRESHKEGLFENWQIMMPERDLNGEQLYNVDGKTIGEYTGLKDKDGREIYEGDVIDIHQTVNGRSKFFVKSCLPVLDIRYAYDVAMRYEYDPYELVDAGKHDTEIEVIGNIYENGNLING